MWVVKGKYLNETAPMSTLNQCLRRLFDHFWESLYLYIYIYIFRVCERCQSKYVLWVVKGKHLNGTVPMGTQNKCFSKRSTFFGINNIFFRHFSTGVGKKLSTEICVVGNQRNRLNGTVPMSTKNKSLSIFHHVLKST